jgi:hypothetical protein
LFGALARRYPADLADLIPSIAEARLTIDDKTANSPEIGSAQACSTMSMIFRRTEGSLIFRNALTNRTPSLGLAARETSVSPAFGPTELTSASECELNSIFAIFAIFAKLPLGGRLVR